jgi:hypothetical protein
MLTESASAKLATPLYIHPNQLRGDRRNMPDYNAQTNFPHPWSGGWWKLRDIVEQQYVSAWATLDLAARHRETVLRNAYLKAKRQTERGRCGSPAAYVIPRSQHDTATCTKMVHKLLVQGIKIHVAKASFEGDGLVYPKSSYVVFLDQPKSGLVKTLLGRTTYPDNSWTRSRDDTPMRPQDTATDTMFEFMGVRVDPVECYLGGEFEKVNEVTWPMGGASRASEYGYALDPRINDSYKAVNRLLSDGIRLARAKCEIKCDKIHLPPGAFIVTEADSKILNKIAKELNLIIYPLDKHVDNITKVDTPRLGMYQRYWGGNMDEGWTRFVLETFQFPYSTIMDKDINEGNLKQRFDTIILPNDPETLITGIDLEQWWEKNNPWRPFPTFPPEYRSGIGEKGIEALKEFVKQGGTLICFDGSTELAINHFKLKLRNVLENYSSKEFFCPGSTLNANINNNHPAAYGMPENSLIFFWNSKAFEIIPSDQNDKYEIIASYPERDILESGWLVGEEKLKRKAAMIVAKVDNGNIVLIGFRPQHRAQTHGTFKLVFNSLYG